MDSFSNLPLKKPYFGLEIKTRLLLQYANHLLQALPIHQPTKHLFLEYQVLRDEFWDLTLGFVELIFQPWWKSPRRHGISSGKHHWSLV